MNPAADSTEVSEAHSVLSRCIQSNHASYNCFQFKEKFSAKCRQNVGRLELVCWVLLCSITGVNYLFYFFSGFNFIISENVIRSWKVCIAISMSPYSREGQQVSALVSALMILSPCWCWLPYARTRTTFFIFYFFYLQKNEGNVCCVSLIYATQELDSSLT